MARSQSIVVKVAGIGASLAAGWLATRLLDAAWRRAAGHDRPSPDDEDAPLAEVAAAVAVAAALAAVVRLLATRGTARAAARLAGPRPD